MLTELNVPVNRKINRKNIMLDSSLCGDCCSCNYSSTYDEIIEETENSCNCNCECETCKDTNENTNKVSCSCCNNKTDKELNNLLSTKNMCHIKGHKMRIRFVGFIYNNINYIVDLDNKHVVYKPFAESLYKKLKDCMIHIQVSPITHAYSLNFHLYNEHKCAEIEVYPNNIKQCNVSVTSLETSEKVILDKNYINFEYFHVRNMLDENRNLITMVGYNDVFNITTEKLLELYTYPEIINLIKTFLNNIYANKEEPLTIINILLQSIKEKLMNDCQCDKEETELDNLMKDESIFDINEGGTVNG